MLYYYIILYSILYILYIILYDFLRALKLLCAAPEYKITFLTPSNNFEAHFLDFDIFHRFSPQTYFWGVDGDGDGGDNGGSGRISSNLQPHSHHAQG